MKLKKSYILLVFIFFTIISGNALAQDPQTLYFMNSVPQSTIMNPAIQPKYNFYLGLPIISSYQLGSGNNRLALTDIIMKHPDNDSLITFLHPDAEFDKTDFLSKIGENNYFYEDARTDLLSFGFRVNSWYFSFNLSEKLTSTINYPKDMLVVALEGNQSFINQNADWSYLGANSDFYREYGLGISKQFGEKLSIGIRGKVLFGHTNIYSNFDENTLNMYSSRDSLFFDADMTVHTSSPYIVSTDEDGNFDGFKDPTFIEHTDSLIDWALMHNNLGFGLDVGFYFKPIEKLALSASLIDLGYINWNTDEVTTLHLKGQYSFKGFDVSDEIGNSDSENKPFEDMLDSLKNSFTVSNTSEDYKTTLSTKVYIGANYQVSKKFNVGVLSRSYILNSSLSQAFTFSANVDLNGLAATVNYSIMNGSYNNVGLGLVLGGAPLQIYIITDNVSSLIWGHQTTSANFRFGLNVAIGSKHKVKSKDSPLLKSSF